MPSRTLVAACALLACTSMMGACANQAGVPREMRAWNRPLAPYQVIGNIYYVGTNGVAQFLITTPEGHILVDSGFQASVPGLAANVRALGFRFEDVKILLASHAHIDHVQGHALVRRMTGAQVIASAPDAPVIAAGGKGEPVFDGVYAWEPCPVDRVVSDGDRVTLGGTTLVAHLTPGHTRGATTWTMAVSDGGRQLAVVFFPSANVNPGVRLVGNPRYPEIATDLESTFAKLKALPCDIFLAPHGGQFAMADKFARLDRGEGVAALVDPAGWQKLLAAAEKTFRDQLALERALAAP